MNFTFDTRDSDSPFVETVWRTRTIGGGSFISRAESRWGMVVTRELDRTYLTLLGPETKAMPTPVPKDAEIFGIVFRIGTFMPYLPAQNIVNGGINLPEASGRSFWLQGTSWQFPNFENADAFVQKLVREDMLRRDSIVDSVLRGHSHALSVRTVRRRFLQATGLTHQVIQQIERAQHAQMLLQQGKSILDTVFEAGYFDQPHLTRSLKRFVGQTPAQIFDGSQ